MTDATDAEALQAEVERLRAENAKLNRRGTRRNRARRASVVGLLVLGSGLAVLSLVAIWLRVTLLDTDRYVSTVAPIAAQPAVQKAVADKLDTAITSRVDFADLARQALPDRADVLAPAIQTGLQSFIRTQIDNFTTSQRFQDLWVEANRRAHTRIVDLLEGGRSKRLVLDQDTVYLDLSPAVDRIKTGLSSRGLDRLAAAIPPSVDGRIQLIQSDGLVKAQRGVRLLKALAIVLPVLAVLSLAGSVFLSRPRRRGLLHAAIGVAVGMLLLVAALSVARSAYLDALGNGALPRDAASDIFDTLAVLLRDGVRIVVIAAAVAGADRLRRGHAADQAGVGRLVAPRHAIAAGVGRPAAHRADVHRRWDRRPRPAGPGRAGRGLRARRADPHRAGDRRDRRDRLTAPRSRRRAAWSR